MVKTHQTVELKALRFIVRKRRHIHMFTTEDEGRWPPNVPLWHAGYFELKASRPKSLRKNFDLPKKNWAGGGGPAPGGELLP